MLVEAAEADFLTVYAEVQENGKKAARDRR